MHWDLPWGKLIFHSLKNRAHGSKKVKAAEHRSAAFTFLEPLLPLPTMQATRVMGFSQSWGASQVVLSVKNPPANAGDARDGGSITGSGKIPWRRKWPTLFSILSWRIPWTEELGGLQSTGWQRVGHD